MSVLWDSFTQHNTIEQVLSDKGLAKTGDAIVNLCYSLAKSLVLGVATGVKVRDDVLAKAIRASSLSDYITRRTDRGAAADSYEALVAYMWMSGKLTIEDVVEFLVPLLPIDNKTSRKHEVEIATEAFRLLLEDISSSLEFPGEE